MPNTSLAGYANLAVYSAMAVLTLATLAYAVFLARWVPARAETVARGAGVRTRPRVCRHVDGIHRWVGGCGRGPVRRRPRPRR